MSGLKQHYIPRFLPRGFGRTGGGKNIQLTVHSRTRGIFRTATHGVGAQRAFYSDPAAATWAETLDDEITAHEQRLVAFIDELRGSPPSMAVGAREAAETVAHLSIRVAHVRDAFASAMIDLLGVVEEVLIDPQAMARLLKLGEPVPSRIVRDLLKQTWAEHQAELRRKGLSRDAFDRLMIQQLRNAFGAAMAEMAPFVAVLMQSLRSRTGEAVRKGHVEALTESLAPAPRIEALARLAWRVEAGPKAGCILPDCVAVAMLDDGDCLPLALAEEDHIRAAVMPLAHDRLLVGTREGQPGPATDTLAPTFAAASWDYFVARDADSELAVLVARVGGRTRAFLMDAVEAARPGGPRRLQAGPPPRRGADALGQPRVRIEEARSHLVHRLTRNRAGRV